MKPLEGKVAVVTGAGRGIGREIASKLAGAGAKVVVNDLDDAPAQETVAAIAAAGGEAIAQPGNVTDDGFADGLVAAAADRLGGLDIIVNNAGYTWDGVVQRMSDDQWHAILDVHLTAPFRILRAAQPVFAAAAKREREAGVPVPCRKVVNISSLAGLSGNPGQVNYATAKAGVVGMTKALSKEWGRYNVTVNAVAFGLIETRLTTSIDDEQASIEVEGNRIAVGVNPQLLASVAHAVPLGRAGTPVEAAGAVYLLCQPESDYISGQTLVCGGGLG